MNRALVSLLVAAVTGTVAPAFSQPVLQGQQGLVWDVPYPPSQTLCDENACCTGPEVWYRVEWTLVGVPFGGNARDFDLLYPPWPPESGCTRPLTHVYPVRQFDIAPGTLVRIAVSGVSPGGASDRSAVVEVFWPWVCAGTTVEEFRDCALDCAASMGAAWCEGS